MTEKWASYGIQTDGKTTWVTDTGRTAIVTDDQAAKKCAADASRHPKAGDVVGDRTVIVVHPTFIVFGKKEGKILNCGTWLTDYEEWFSYKRQVEGMLANGQTHS